MTKHLLHISECYMSFQQRLEELTECAGFGETSLEIANSTSEAKEQEMWLWVR